MDFTRILPVELSQKIFSYLNAEDLWKAFNVAITWRDIVNSNSLWKPICLLDNLDLNEIPAQGDPYRELCKYARIWASWRWKCVKNWENSAYIQTEMPALMLTEVSVSSYHNKLAISNGSDVIVYSRDNHLIMTNFKEEFGEGGVRDIEINKDYLLVLQQTCVLLYKTMGFSPYLLFGFSNSGNRFEIHRKYVEDARYFEEWSVEFAILYDNTLWLGPYLFLSSAVIVDLNTGNHRNIQFPWKCTLLRTNENVIARSDYRLAVYSIEGEMLFETDCTNYTWIKTCKSVLILLADNFVDTFDRLTGNKLKTIQKSFLDLAVNYSLDILYGIKKSGHKGFINLEAVDLITGNSLWEVSIEGDYSAEVRPFLNSFLCFDCTNIRHWYVIDSKTGNCLFDHPFVGRLIYISSFFWVCQQANKVIIRYY